MSVFSQAAYLHQIYPQRYLGRSFYWVVNGYYLNRHGRI